MPVWNPIPNLPEGPANSNDEAMIPEEGVSVAVPRYFTEDDLLDLVDRILPFDYLQPLKVFGPGYELYQMMAAVFERVSFAIGRTECSMFVTTAHGGYKAEADVEFYRENDLNGDITMLAGTVVRNSVSKLEYVLVADVEMTGGTSLVAPGVVRAKQADYAFNVSGPVTDANGNILEGEIDEVNLPIMEPPAQEPIIKVRQTSDAVCGQPASLDALGDDRSIRRVSNEPDDAYRVRVQTLPDTVSIDAIRRQMDLIFERIGFNYTLIETWNNEYQTAYDMETLYLNEMQGDIDPNLWAYDDERTDPVFFGRWYGPEDYMSGIILVVPQLPAFNELGFAYDDPGNDWSDDFETLTGRRAVPTYDAVTPNSVYDVSAYDGDDIGKNQFFLDLYELLQKIKPAGVFATIELEGN